MTQEFPSFKLTINGKSWESPTVPVLLQILSGASTAQDLLPAGSVYPLPANKVIQLSLPAGVAGGPHPFHLHGVSATWPPSPGRVADPEIASMRSVWSAAQARPITTS